MCCRYLLLKESLERIAEALAAELGGAADSRYNVAPGTDIPVVRAHPRTRRREVALIRWGFAQEKAGETATAAPIHVNARAEGLAERPAFRAAFRARRCLVPVSGFYEWQKAGRQRRPFLFRRRDGQPFCLAGLWAAPPAAGAGARETCAIITTAPNDLMRPIHHRMPAILPPEDWARWLDPAAADPRALGALLRPFPAAELTAQALDTRVNNVRHDDPACLAPASAVENAGEPAQLSLEL